MTSAPTARVLRALAAAVVLSLAAGCSRWGFTPGPRLRNPDLVAWTNGPSSAPDGWVLGGPGTGAVRPGSAVPGGHSFGAIVSARSGDLALYQDVDDARLAVGHPFKFEAWVKATSPGVAQLSINAGQQIFASRWHSGNGSWELLTSAGTVPPGASSLRFHAWARNGAEVEVGGFSLSIEPAPAAPLRNPDFAAWSGGEAAPPDGWALGGEGSGAVRRGPSGAPGAAFAAEVGAAQGEVALYQDLEDAHLLAGRRFWFQTWVRTETPEAVRLAVSGGSSRFLSLWHPGDGRWELLVAFGTVPKDASKIRFSAWARKGSSMQVGGSALWIGPAPHPGLRPIALGALALCLLAGLLVPSIRRRALDALRREWRPAESGRPLDGVRRWLSPERFLIVAGGLAGLAFAVLTPPLQAPDEPAHFFRAFAVSEGRFLPEVRVIDGKQIAGALIPRSFFRMQDAVGRWDLPFHPERKFDPGSAFAELRKPLSSGDREFHDFGAPSRYAPVPYLPQALAIAAGRAAGLSPLALLYLARIANLLCWVAGMWLAVRIAPLFKWGLTLLALSPMSVFLAGSASPDVVTDWLSFLLVAAFLHAAFGEDALLRRGGIARLALLSVLLSLCKQVYFVLSLLLLLVPARKLRGAPRRALLLAGLVALQLAAILAWTYLAIQGHPAIRSGSNPAEQIALVLGDPLRMIAVLLRTHRVYANFYLSSFVGILGWLDVAMPSWLIVSYLFVALICSIFYGLPRRTLRARHRMLLLLTAVATWSMVLGYHYLIWTKVGAPVIDGGMGRYLIPLSPLALLAIAGGSAGSSGEPIKLRLAGFLSLVLGTALLCTVRRYYL
ncbi:MAG: DUF2142 domain-containing protein [Myxococcales bacterium]